MDSPIDPTDRPDPRGGGVVADDSLTSAACGGGNYSGADQAAAGERLVVVNPATGKIPVLHLIRAPLEACVEEGG